MSVIGHFFRWSVGLAKAETQTTVNERACLQRHAQGRRRLAEIGVWHGVTTTLLRQAMATDGILFAVDPFLPGRLGFSIQKIIAHREVAKSSNGTVNWLRLPGNLAALDKTVGVAPIDFLFIDGDHSYEGIQADWEAWSPLISHDGIVAFHDSRSTPDRPIENAGSVLYTQSVVLADSRFVLLDEVESITVVRRNS